MKICLDAGHAGSKTNPGVAAEYFESAVMWELQKKLAEVLLTYRDVEIVTTRDDIDTDPSVTDRGELAKGCDLFLSLHSNAVGGENDDIDRAVLIPSVVYPEMALAEEFGTSLTELFRKGFDVKQSYQVMKLTYPNDPKHDYYGVLRGAASVGVPGMIIEHSFHTSPRFCRWAMKAGSVEKIAETEASVIASHYGLEKRKQEEAPVSETKMLYRVQVGAFSHYENAVAYCENLKKDGYSAFVTKTVVKGNDCDDN